MKKDYVSPKIAILQQGPWYTVAPMTINASENLAEDANSC
jgi:hypothetical protein